MSVDVMFTVRQLSYISALLCLSRLNQNDVIVKAEALTALVRIPRSGWVLGAGGAIPAWCWVSWPNSGTEARDDCSNAKNTSAESGWGNLRTGTWQRVSDEPECRPGGRLTWVFDPTALVGSGTLLLLSVHYVAAWILSHCTERLSYHTYPDHDHLAERLSWESLIYVGLWQLAASRYVGC